MVQKRHLTYMGWPNFLDVWILWVFHNVEFGNMTVIKIRDTLPSFGGWGLVYPVVLVLVRIKALRENGGTGRTVVLVLV